MRQYEDIRRYIEKEGLSERAVAKLMGISRNTVRKYRNGDPVSAMYRREQPRY